MHGVIHPRPALHRAREPPYGHTYEPARLGVAPRAIAPRTHHARPHTYPQLLLPRAYDSKRFAGALLRQPSAWRPHMSARRRPHPARRVAPCARGPVPAGSLTICCNMPRPGPPPSACFFPFPKAPARPPSVSPERRRGNATAPPWKCRRLHYLWKTSPRRYLGLDCRGPGRDDRVPHRVPGAAYCNTTETGTQDKNMFLYGNRPRRRSGMSLSTFPNKTPHGKSAPHRAPESTVALVGGLGAVVTAGRNAQHVTSPPRRIPRMDISQCACTTTICVREHGNADRYL